MSDVKSLMSLMRTNNFETDPLSVVEGCDPPRIPSASISNRLDLGPKNGTCVFEEFDIMVGHKRLVYRFEWINKRLLNPDSVQIWTVRFGLQSRSVKIEKM